MDSIFHKGSNMLNHSTFGVSDNYLGAVRWRCIGPPRGGRVVAVAGDPVDPAVFYFGACAGGVWKTADGGTYWQNISDGFFNTASVGALAVSESDNNVVYAGMGEACIRIDVTHGDGVYRSTDAGHTWVHLGLEDTRHISRVRIHPNNPDVVYVAALGNAFNSNEERGIFRSTNGGTDWEHVLYKDEDTGAADLSIDTSNPRIMYAALWEARRSFWSIKSGGDQSGIYRSMDGGDTWEIVSSKKGFAKGVKGRIGVAASPAKSGRVWATVESEDCGVYRSDDFGETWELVNEDKDLQGRPWYYQHIIADPQDPEVVWIMNYQCHKSIDGGKTFTVVATPHGDNHDLWIDPKNSQRMIQGNDGGACVSFNGGTSFSTIYNQLTAQFYHLSTDNRYPYRIYGTQQDNSAISVPSQTNKGAIPWEDCYFVGSSESGYIAVDPNNPDIVISGAVGSSPGGGGNMLRYDHGTGQMRIITVWPELNIGYGAENMKYRFQWTYPILFSPHDSSVLYAAGNIIFKSLDQGASWTPISPDLTRHDEETLKPSGGPVTLDTSGAETYATVFSFAASKIQEGVLWAGSDDGLVHISRDDGATWKNITPDTLPEWSMVTMIEPSNHLPGTAYLSATKYKLGDNSPMLYMTEDYGDNWRMINGNLPSNDFTRCIREDPDRPKMIYTGTETKVYVSFDDGNSWSNLGGEDLIGKNSLPIVPIYDIVIKNDDLIVATHGRSFWILDDLSQLRQVPEIDPSHGPQILKPRASVRPLAPLMGTKKSTASQGKNYNMALGGAAYIETNNDQGDVDRQFLDAGENPLEGVVINYFLPEDMNEEISLTFVDDTGSSIITYTNVFDREGDVEDEALISMTSKAGMNRFVWDMRYPPANKVPGDKTTEARVISGPLASPGQYSVNLKTPEVEVSKTFEIIKDPRVPATQKDLDDQFEFLITIRDRLSETHDAINRLRSVRDQVREWTQRAMDQSYESVVKASADKIEEKLNSVEQELVQTAYEGQRDRLNLPTRLNNKLSEIGSVVSSGDFAPTKQSYEVFRVISDEIEPHLIALQATIDCDVSDFENLVHELGVPAIIGRPQ